MRISAFTADALVFAVIETAEAQSQWDHSGAVLRSTLMARDNVRQQVELAEVARLGKMVARFASDDDRALRQEPQMKITSS
ncbi:hypothetical protein ACVWZV_000305 [Bradyrhizobium sp. GM5.1]